MDSRVSHTLRCRPVELHDSHGDRLSVSALVLLLMLIMLAGVGS